MQEKLSLLLKLTEIFNKNYFLKNFIEIFYDIADVKKNALIAEGILVRGLRNLPNQIDVVLYPFDIGLMNGITDIAEHRVCFKNSVDFWFQFGLV
jgi:hypothetical protein